MDDGGYGSSRSTRHRFDELFRAHYADLYRYAVRRCPSSEDAEDLVAETFTVAWRRIHDVPDGNEARLWLFGTARLLRMNQLRSITRRRALRDRVRRLMAGSREQDPAVPVAGTSRVGKAMRRLSGPDREILLLAAWEGLSSQEIASVLEITAAAARKRLQRARDRLREALGSEEPNVNTATVVAKEMGR